LGEVGVDDHDVVVEHDPDVVAAAEDAGVGGADGAIAEEDAGGDLLDVVEFHVRQLGRRREAGGQDKAEGHPGEGGDATHDDSPGDPAQAGRRALPVYAEGRASAMGQSARPSGAPPAAGNPGRLGGQNATDAPAWPCYPGDRRFWILKSCVEKTES